jgi:NhaP-type Na+/H+ or K+/H+ antiporter
VFGTIVSSLTVGVIIYYAGLAGFSAPLPLSHALAFGSLISSVDPVATLSIFSSVNLSSTLYMIAFGESVLNGAVAVVLFTSFSVQSDAEHANVPSAIIHFVDITFFSVGVGMTTALSQRQLGFTLTTIVAILIGRAMNVFPIGWLLNRRARLQLSWQEQAIMWFSGLRSASSYCLATNAPSASLLDPCTLTSCSSPQFSSGAAPCLLFGT